MTDFDRDWSYFDCQGERQGARTRAELEALYAAGLLQDASFVQHRTHPERMRWEQCEILRHRPEVDRSERVASALKPVDHDGHIVLLLGMVAVGSFALVPALGIFAPISLLVAGVCAASNIAPFFRSSSHCVRVAGGSQSFQIWFSLHYGFIVFSVAVFTLIHWKFYDTSFLHAVGAWLFIGFLVIPLLTGFIVLKTALQARRALLQRLSERVNVMAAPLHLALWLLGSLAISAAWFLASWLMRNPYEGPSLEAIVLCAAIAAALRIMQGYAWFRDYDKLLVASSSEKLVDASDGSESQRGS